MGIRVKSEEVVKKALEYYKLDYRSPANTPFYMNELTGVISALKWVLDQQIDYPRIEYIRD